MDREKDVTGGAERVYPLRYTPRVRRPRTFAKFAKTTLTANIRQKKRDATGKILATDLRWIAKKT